MPLQELGLEKVHREFVVLTRAPLGSCQSWVSCLRLISAFRFHPNYCRMCWTSCTIVTQSSVLFFLKEMWKGAARDGSRETGNNPHSPLPSAPELPQAADWPPSTELMRKRGWTCDQQPAQVEVVGLSAATWGFEQAEDENNPLSWQRELSPSLLRGPFLQNRPRFLMFLLPGTHIPPLTMGKVNI